VICSRYGLQAKMRMSKYFDWKRDRPLPESDGCSLEVLPQCAGERSFCLHLDGFPISLGPAAIDQLGEDACGDPYNTATETGNEHQSRRMAITLKLLWLALPASGPSRVLDVACGQGFITGAVQKALSDVEISALDGSEAVVGDAVRESPEFESSAADAHNPPYQEGYIDVVACSTFWERPPEPLLGLRSIVRLLRSCVAVFVSTPSRYHFGRLIGVPRGLPNNFLSRRHVIEYAAGRVIGQMRSGLTQVEQIGGDPHRAVSTIWPRRTALVPPFAEVAAYPFTIRDIGLVRW